MAAFTGFPPDAFAFYQQLDADNTKAFWTANKATYQQSVRAPFEALADDLAKYGPFHLFRPNNDVRFAKGRPPYKVQQGMVGESQGGAMHYVQITAEALMAASGYYVMASDQLERFRAAVDDARSGAAIAKVVAALETEGFSMGAISELKTAPRGYAKDHPRIALLRRKGLIAVRTFPLAKWMHTPAAASRIVDVWKACQPLNKWLDKHVGPSTLPPDEDGWRR